MLIANFTAKSIVDYSRRIYEEIPRRDNVWFLIFSLHIRVKRNCISIFGLISGHMTRTVIDNRVNRMITDALVVEGKTDIDSVHVHASKSSSKTVTNFSPSG